MEVAHVISQRSLCMRARVGCVIVTEGNRIVATGYNGPPTGFIHNGLPCTEWCERSMPGDDKVLSVCYEDCPSLHAELNALSVCDRTQREGGTLYVTGDICHACAKMIANSGISHVVVDRRDPREYRLPDVSYELLERCGVTVMEWEG